MLVPRTFLRPVLLALPLLWWVVPAPVSLAQDPRGALQGTVADTTGARIPDAKISIRPLESSVQRDAVSNRQGEFRLEFVPPATYRVSVKAPGFAEAVSEVAVAVSSVCTVSVVLKPEAVRQSVQVQGTQSSVTTQPIDLDSGVQKTVVSVHDLVSLPLAHRSFANIAYLSPMTEPVEPSDPTKARITAVSFGGSSGLNVDLSIDGGDDNDDYIGGFLQNYSPDAIQEFAIRTVQADADTSRTNGGSVVITTRRGTDEWHGGGALYVRDSALNARFPIDNPAPEPKQPFSRQNVVGALGGPLHKGKLWFFSSLEYIRENASIAYSENSLAQFNALAQLVNNGLLPGVSPIQVPATVPVPFRDALFATRLDWAQSQRSQWFFRGALDRYSTHNDLVAQATLPSTGVATHSDYSSLLIGQQFQFSSSWLGSLTFEASNFHHTKDPNSHLALALAFPFSSTFHTISGLQTFGDNQFATPIATFPVRRDQQKYQFRYDVAHAAGSLSPKFGINFVHEPVLSGALFSAPEASIAFPSDPAFYLRNPAQFAADLAAGCPSRDLLTRPPCTPLPGSDGTFSQSVRRLGAYVEASWHALPRLTINYGLRYDTTFGLFRAEGRLQNQNPAFVTLQALGIPLVSGIPHDYRGAVAPRLGLAYAPSASGSTVIRAGVGLYYNDLTQNGWVNAFQGVNNGSLASGSFLSPGQQGALIDPHYSTPYGLQASAGVERAFHDSWRISVNWEHQQGVHQYRRYEYISAFTLPANAPNISLFRTDNRSRYDGVSLLVEKRMSRHFDFLAHYTLASAATWGATVGELFDYVNGVTDPRNAFGPGDHGPSGEDVRHRFVIAGTAHLPGKFEVTTLSQFESARPFTLTTTVDLNNDGTALNDRAVVNGIPTSLDGLRGTPFQQIDLRVSREFNLGERLAIRPFAEFFNLLNRSNPGNNYVTSLGALPVPQTPSQLANATLLCLDPACTTTRPIQSRNDLRQPAGALGDFFGPGTTVGIPFAAQLGVRVTF